MNITLRVEDESVKSLLNKLSDVDLNIVEIFDEDSRNKPKLRSAEQIQTRAGDAVRAAVRGD